MANSMAIFAAEKLIGKDIEKPLLSSEEKGTDRKAVTYGALNADTLPLTGDRVIRIRELLGQDHENNVRDLINSRWFFRKFANYTESLGNVLLYLGTGLSTIATGVTILGPKETANTLQFISTACFAAHVTLIGFARCSAREEDQKKVSSRA